MDTIFATATGQPPAALAILRISGPDAIEAGATLAGSLPKPRRAALRSLRDEDGALLDQSVVLVFPGPGSATGEDVVELHCHGGRAVIAAIERRLGGLAGLRPAVAGEFTRRALTNGRIDLAEAQGLADLLEAESEEQRRAAMAAVDGQVGRLVRGWIDELRIIAAMIEAELNFADDLDGPTLTIEQVMTRLAPLRASWARLLDAPPVERLKDGVRIVIAGPPNAGKSTLLNLLCERDAAIVSDVAGTTRDLVEAPVMRHGRGYLFTDTAGLHDTSCSIEGEGIRRAREALEAADVILWLGEDAPPYANAMWVHSRSDESGRGDLSTGQAIAVSREDHRSIASLWELIETATSGLRPQRPDVALHRGQRDRVARALAEIDMIASDDLVVFAELIRRASEELSCIVGYGATEEMLDALFGRFCIGK